MFPRTGNVCSVIPRLLHHVRCISQSAVKMSKDMRSHYDVLGVTPSASQTQIRDAFLRLSKQVHPDVNRNDPSSKDKFLRLQDAYTVLGKRESRREYDRQFQQTHRTTASHSSRFTGPFTPPKQSHYGRENTTSRMHEEQKEAEEQYRGSRAWEEYRNYYQLFQDNMQRRKAKQQHTEWTKMDDSSSLFEKIIDMLHRSAAYRPFSTLFIPGTVLVVLIYAGISCTIVIWRLCRGARIDKEFREEMHTLAEKRRLQESTTTGEGS